MKRKLRGIQKRLKPVGSDLFRKIEKVNNESAMRTVETLIDYEGYLRGRALSADVDAIRAIARMHVARKVVRTR